MAYRYKFMFGEHKPVGEWRRDGKPEWPNMLDIEMSHDDALRLIRDLASQMVGGDGSSVLLTWSGKLHESEDE